MIHPNVEAKLNELAAEYAAKLTIERVSVVSDEIRAEQKVRDEKLLADMGKRLAQLKFQINQGDVDV